MVTNYLPTLLNIFTLSCILNTCVASQKVADKSDVQLWGGKLQPLPQCTRPPGEFNNDYWDIAGMHLQVKPNLSKSDAEKITEFFKMCQ